MGQTVIELDTGKRLDVKTDGFCWSTSTFDVETRVLVVPGCYWAAPYEFRFYDFSDPFSGWPEVEAEGGVEYDERPPTFHPGGLIRTYQTEVMETGDDLGPIVATKTYRREGLVLKLVSEDVTPKEQERRRRNEEFNRKWEQECIAYKTTDPLWLRLQALVREAPFRATHTSIGRTYDGWCPTWSGEEKRFCQHIGGQKGYAFDVEIAHATGPVKLYVSKDGTSVGHHFFPHSVEGIDQAFQYARDLMQ